MRPTVTTLASTGHKRLPFGLLGALGVLCATWTGCALDDRRVDSVAPVPNESVEPVQPSTRGEGQPESNPEDLGRDPSQTGSVDANDVGPDAGGEGGECTVGDSECTSVTQKRECNTDGRWTATVDCAPACIGSQCGGECVPGVTECLSAIQYRGCSNEGVWSTAQECEAACFGNACGGECKPNDTQCVSATEVQTCTDEGVWASSTTCSNACVDRACT